MTPERPRTPRMRILGRQAVPPDPRDEIRDRWHRLRELDSPEAKTLVDLTERAHPWLIADERARIRARQDHLEKRRDELVTEFPALKAVR